MAREKHMINQNTNIDKLAESVEIFHAAQKIGDEFGLHIDQVGELDAQIRQVLIGKAKPDKFSDDIKEALEITNEIAAKVTAKVNDEVFKVLRNLMQQETTTPTTPPNNTAIEQAGNFQVENENKDYEHPKEIDTSAIMNHIEKDSEPVNVPQPKTEPLVDQLLSGPAAVPEERVEEKPVVNTEPAAPKTESAPSATPPTSPTPAPVQKPPEKRGPDPYREPTN